MPIHPARKKCGLFDRLLVEIFYTTPKGHLGLISHISCVTVSFYADV